MSASARVPGAPSPPLQWKEGREPCAGTAGDQGRGAGGPASAAPNVSGGGDGLLSRAWSFKEQRTTSRGTRWTRKWHTALHQVSISARSDVTAPRDPDRKQGSRSRKCSERRELDGELTELRSRDHRHRPTNPPHLLDAQVEPRETKRLLQGHTQSLADGRLEVNLLGPPWGSRGKESSCQCRGPRFDP